MVYVFCIIFGGYYLYQIIIIKEHFVCTYFYFLLSFWTYAHVDVAINLHLANS